MLAFWRRRTIWIGRLLQTGMKRESEEKKDWESSVGELKALDVKSDGDVAAEDEWEITGAGWRTYNSSRAEARTATAAAAAAAQIDIQDEHDEELKYTKRKTPDVKAGASTRVYIGHACLYWRPPLQSD